MTRPLREQASRSPFVRPGVCSLVWTLAACSQSSVLTYNTKGNDTADTGVSGTTGGSTGEVIEQDPVYDDSGDADSGTEPDADPVYTWASWSGERTYAIAKTDPRASDCTGITVSESGLRIETDLEVWQDHCRICSDFYEVTYTARSACSGDIDLSLPEVRGFVLRGADLEVWRIRQDGSETDVEIEFNDAPFDDGRADFSFDYSWNGEGTVSVSGFTQLAEETTP
jgi:hypothetical protein